MSDVATGILFTDDAVPANPIRVLHVDDEPEALDLAKTLLERLDDRISVRNETKPGNAILRINEEPFDCVVSDYDMPGMTGLELLEAVRTEYPELPFVLFTGKGSEEIASRAISAGVTDYIQKGGPEKYEILANEILTVASEYQTKHALEWYQSAIEATQDAIYVRDDENRFVAMNDSFRELTGYATEQVVGSLPSLIKEEAAFQAVERHIEALRRPSGPDDVVFEVLVHPATGDPIPCEDHMSVIRSESGEFLGTVGALRDIRRRKDREREMEKRLGQQEAVAQLGQLATAERDLDALMEAVVNAVANGLRADYAKILQARPDERDLLLRAGVGWDDGYVGSATVGMERESQAGYTLLTDEPVEVEDLATEERFAGPDLLTDHGVVSGISLVIGSSSDPWGILGVHDTERREFDDHDVGFVQSVVHVLESAIERREDERRIESLNERLQQRTQQLDTFAGVLSHDLKNPLNIALARISLARDNDDEESLEAAARAVSRSIDMVDNLSDAMREGMVVDALVECDVESIARTAWETVNTPGSTLWIEGTTTVDADRGALLRLFENLLRNAIEHAGDTVEITVGGSDEEFYIADDGPGIPAEDRDRVFESGYTTKEDGTGFGLLSVRQIVDGHDWEIAVGESTDGGARFDIITAG